jgi:hypothetical protein
MARMSAAARARLSKDLISKGLADVTAEELNAWKMDTGYTGKNALGAYLNEQRAMQRSAPVEAPVISQEPSPDPDPIMSRRQRRGDTPTTLGENIAGRGGRKSTQPENKELDRSIIPTPIKAGLTSLISSEIWDETFLDEAERERLKEVALGRVKRGSSNISYMHIDPKEAGSKISKRMKLPDFGDVNQTLKFTVGKAKIVRDGDDVFVADEFDFPLTPETEALKDKSFFEKAKFLAGKTKKFFSERGEKNPELSLYGLANYVGEVIGPQAGEGPSVRFNLGDYKELGIKPEQFNMLPTLEQYEEENAFRIKQRSS